MRRFGLLLLAVSLPAHADPRLDSGAIPDLSLIEPLYPLDRFSERTFKMCGNEADTDLFGTVAAGVVSYDANSSPGASVMVAGSSKNNQLFATARSELTATTSAFIRGHHRALVELQTSDEGTQIAVGGHLEHGRALGLAPIHLGPGRRVDAGIASRALIPLAGRHAKNGAWSLAVRGDAGATLWRGAPALDSAGRHSLGLALGRMPLDGELPRGDIELLRGRVEHVTIKRPIAAAGTESLDGAVRIAELGLGTDDLTLHIDRELLGVVAIDLGWSWLEADTAAGTIADSAFRMRLSTALR